jgi:AcrR family transcriptional regulator
VDSIWMRPERAAAGRPARYSRAGITAAALAIADQEGLDAVSMRRVAAELGTGAASLYRYVETRDELLDLMTDATGAEYELSPPTGDWLTDLIAVGEQARLVLRRHRWLAGLSITRPVIGPHGIALMEHVLDVLRPHPAGAAAKMEAFAMLNGVTAAFALQELADPGLRERNTAYLQHAIVCGQRPRLAQLITQPPAAADMNPVDRYPDLMARILTGILGPASLSCDGGAGRGGAARRPFGCSSHGGRAAVLAVKRPWRSRRKPGPGRHRRPGCR